MAEICRLCHKKTKDSYFLIDGDWLYDSPQGDERIKPNEKGIINIPVCDSCFHENLIEDKKGELIMVLGKHFVVNVFTYVKT